MSELLSVGTLIEIVKYGGPAAILFVVWYLSHRAEIARWEETRKDDRIRTEAERKVEAETRDRDRREHMAKWDSMIAQQDRQVSEILTAHKNELDRAYTLLGRQTQAIELQAHLFSVLTEKINQNQFCPIVRDRQQGAMG